MMKAVIFDMDGVIFDTERLVLECWAEVAKNHGITDIEEACQACLGVNEKETRMILTERYGEDFPYEQYCKEASEIFAEKTEGKGIPEKPGVRELIAWLKKRGTRIGLATSSSEKDVLGKLDAAGLRFSFDAIVCGDMVERSKPEPDIYQEACHMLHVKPEKAFAVEDSYNGVRSASQAGMRVIMVPDLMPPNKEMRRLASVILPSLKDVPEYIEEDEMEEMESMMELESLFF